MRSNLAAFLGGRLTDSACLHGKRRGATSGEHVAGKATLRSFPPLLPTWLLQQGPTPDLCREKKPTLPDERF